MKQIYIEKIEDNRRNLTQKEKNNLKHELLYSRQPINFLVFRFIEILEKNGNVNLELFYKNLKNLEIIIDDGRIKETNKFYKIEDELTAYYEPAINRIVLKSNFELVDLYHELIHVASTILNNNTYLSGIYYGKNEIDLNEYLNEGYTQLLTNRLFNFKSDDFYLDNIHAIKLFEDIIGKEKLLNYYFNADFYNFINELLKWDSEENIYEFMTQKKSKNNKFMKKYLKNIYIKALYIKFLNKEITQEQFEYKIAYFFKRFKFKNLDKECEIFLDDYKENIKNKYNKIYIKKGF